MTAAFPGKVKVTKILHFALKMCNDSSLSAKVNIKDRLRV